MRRHATRTHRNRHRPLEVAAGIGALLLATVVGASAAPGDQAGDSLREPGSHWFSIGILSGSTRLDDGLADYQWDMTPRVDWGAQTLLGRGRLAIGLRLWRARTTQQLDPSNVSSSAEVRATSTELVGHGRLAAALGCELMAVASGGFLHLGYHPDRVSIASAGGGAPIAVDLTPVNEWIGGAGLALRRPLRGPWAAGVELDHRLFGLDTAHRNGVVIEYGRRTFGDWSARLELAWVSRRP
jgi:hypothetical protein